MTGVGPVDLLVARFPPESRPASAAGVSIALRPAVGDLALLVLLVEELAKDALAIGQSRLQQSSPRRQSINNMQDTLGERDPLTLGSDACPCAFATVIESALVMVGLRGLADVFGAACCCCGA